MPIDPVGTSNGAVWIFNVQEENGANFSIDVQQLTATEQQTDDAVQELVNVLDTQTWVASVTAVKVARHNHAVTPD